MLAAARWREGAYVARLRTGSGLIGIKSVMGSERHAEAILAAIRAAHPSVLAIRGPPDLCRDRVLQDESVAGDDRDHHADGLASGGVAGAYVLGHRCSGGNYEPVDLAGC
jgi:uncharacterized protein YcfJ